MDALAPYLFLWNSWMVFPALLVIAAWTYWKFRKTSLAVLTVGLALDLVAEGLRVAFPAPLHPGYLTSLVIGGVALVATLTGAVWFFWKDYRAIKNAT